MNKDEIAEKAAEEIIKSIYPSVTGNKVMERLERELKAEQLIWERELASEQLAGNVVKEHFARGNLAQIRVILMALTPKETKV